MRVAAIQMNAVFANVAINLEKAGAWVEKAVAEGAEIVILPEFFTSGIGFSEKMLTVALQNEAVLAFIQKLSEQRNVIIGGSSILFDGVDAHNVFHLVFPNGQIFSHKKDIPTQFENCYYTKGDTDNILDTPIGKIGVALCWEMIRYDTVKRLAGKVDVVFAGSCWWDLPDQAPPEKDDLRKFNQQLALETPVTLARLLHVPLVHASHCGKIAVKNFPQNDVMQTRSLVGATQIINNDGNVIAKRSFEQGEGMVIAELQKGMGSKPVSATDSIKYWIPDLPMPYIQAWEKLNPLGEAYYHNITLPKYKDCMKRKKKE